MPILCNNNPIIIHTNNIRLVRGNPVFRTSIVSPGETPTFRASCVSPGVTPTFRAPQSRPRKHPLSAHLTQPLCVAAAGFREPPELPAWRWKTPYTTIVAFEVFYMYLVYTPEGIILANGILYYLSEVVVLEPARTGLYLERRLLDKHWCAGLTAGEDVGTPAVS